MPYVFSNIPFEFDVIRVVSQPGISRFLQPLFLFDQILQQRSTIHEVYNIFLKNSGYLSLKTSHPGHSNEWLFMVENLIIITIKQKLNLPDKLQVTFHKSRTF